MSNSSTRLGAMRPTDRGTRRTRPDSLSPARPGRARLTLSIDDVTYQVRPIDREPGDGLAAGFLLHELDDAGRSVQVLEIHEYHDPLDSPLLDALPGLACSCAPTPEDCGAPPCRHLRAAAAAGLLRPFTEEELWELGRYLAPTSTAEGKGKGKVKAADHHNRLAFEEADPSLWATFAVEDESQEWVEGEVEGEGGESC